MIYRQTVLNVADNTGARIAQCIGIHRKPADVASVGRLIKVAIKDIRNNVMDLKVKPGQVHNALIIRQRKELRRGDGRCIRFDENACILLGPDFKPLGTKVIGPVPSELRKNNWLKTLNVAFKVI